MSRNKRIYIILLSIIIVATFLISFIVVSSNKSDPPNFQMKPYNEGNDMGNILKMGALTYDEKYVYYISAQTIPPSLMKMDADGERKIIHQSPNDDFLFYLNVVDNWIYYVDNKDEKVYRIDTDGNNFEKISDVNASLLYAYRGFLYIISPDFHSPRTLCRMNFDGTDIKILSDDNVGDMFFDDEIIYYSTYDVNDGRSYIYIIGLEGNEKIKVERNYNDQLSLFGVYKNNIYYGSGEAMFRKFNTIDSSLTYLESTALKNSIVTHWTIKENIIIYLGNPFSNSFFQFDLENELMLPRLKYDKRKSLDPMLYTTDKHLYFYQEDKLHRITYDGKKLERIE